MSILVIRHVIPISPRGVLDARLEVGQNLFEFKRMRSFKQAVERAHLIGACRKGLFPRLFVRVRFVRERRRRDEELRVALLKDQDRPVVMRVDPRRSEDPLHIARGTTAAGALLD